MMFSFLDLIGDYAISAGISAVPERADRLDVDQPIASQHLQQLGGFAALFQTALSLLSFLFILVIWPMYGVRGPDDASNPALVLPALAQAPILTIFFLALGMMRLLSWPQVARLYVQDQASAATAYAALSLLDTSIDGAAIFAFAWWALLTKWGALHTGRLLKLPAPVGLLVGSMGIVAGVVPPLRPVALVLVLVWTPWLSVVLLRHNRVIR